MSVLKAANIKLLVEKYICEISLIAKVFNSSQIIFPAACRSFRNVIARLKTNQCNNFLLILNSDNRYSSYFLRKLSHMLLDPSAQSH